MKKLFILCLCAILFTCGCAPQTNRESGITTPKSSLPVPEDYKTANVLSKTETMLYFQKIVPWSEYAKAEIHQTEISVSLDKKIYNDISLVDDDMNLYISTGQDKMMFPDITPELGIYSLNDGTYQRFAEPASGRDPYYLAVDRNYIVWVEAVASGVALINPVMHVYVKATKEDITFTLPVVDLENVEDQSFPPQSPVLILGDKIYMDVIARMIPGEGKIVDLYAYDIPSRKLELYQSNAAKPFLYRGELAWYSIDYAEKQVSVKKAGSDKSILDLDPKQIVEKTLVFDDIMFVNDTVQSWQITFEGAFCVSSDGVDGSGLRMIQGGASVPILAGRNATYVDSQKTNGRLLTFFVSNQYKHPMFYDIARSVLVELTDVPEGAYSAYFLRDRLVFINQTSQGSESTLKATVLWVGLDDVGVK